MADKDKQTEGTGTPTLNPLKRPASPYRGSQPPAKQSKPKRPPSEPYVRRAKGTVPTPIVPVKEDGARDYGKLTTRELVTLASRGYWSRTAHGDSRADVLRYLQSKDVEQNIPILPWKDVEICKRSQEAVKKATADYEARTTEPLPSLEITDTNRVEPQLVKAPKSKLMTKRDIANKMGDGYIKALQKRDSAALDIINTPQLTGSGYAMRHLEEVVGMLAYSASLLFPGCTNHRAGDLLYIL
jgi:hypothetical protein